LNSPNDDDLRVARREATLLLRLHEREIQVLQWVFADLERLLTDDTPPDPVTQRLFPRAYLDPTEEEAESQWQQVAHGDLVEVRLSALNGVIVGLEGAQPKAGAEAMREVALDDAQAEAWLGVLNDARLAFGTALGITADTDLEDLEADDPRAEGYAVYDWLTHLLAALLGALSGPDDDGELEVDLEP